MLVIIYIGMLADDVIKEAPTTSFSCKRKLSIYRGLTSMFAIYARGKRSTNNRDKYIASLFVMIWLRCSHQDNIFLENHIYISLKLFCCCKESIYIMHTYIEHRHRATGTDNTEIWYVGKRYLYIITSWLYI